MPAVVLCIQYKIRGDDGSAHCDHGEDDIDEEHEAIDVVEFVGPKRSEYEVHLDEDGAERQETRQRDDQHRVRPPGTGGDRSRDGIDAAGKCLLLAE